jgi:hypothetical protein
MSEKVSLDFLISLKQANTNVEQTRKVGGIMDYLATAAKKANDALFNTSDGQDAVKLTGKASAKKRKFASLDAAAMAAAGMVAGKVMTASIALVKTSIGVWAENHIALIKYRQELGMTAAEHHKLTLGVSRSAALYGTSMRSVRDIAGYMAKGATEGTAEISKMSGALALLVDYGGVRAGTLTDFIQKQTFVAKKSDEQAKHMAFAIKKMAADANIPAEDLLRTWTNITQVMPMVTSKRGDFDAFITSMMVGVGKTRQSTGALGEYIATAMDQNSALHTRVMSNKGDFEAATDDIFRQLSKAWQGHDESNTNSVKSLMLLAQNQFDFQSYEQVKAFMLAKEYHKKHRDEAKKTFAMGSGALEAALKRDLSAMEQIGEKMNKLKGMAGNFWESWLGGPTGKALVKMLNDTLTATIIALEELAWLTGKRDVKKKAGTADLAKEQVQREMGVAYGVLNQGRRDEIAMGGQGPEERRRLFNLQRDTAVKTGHWRSGTKFKGSETFTPPEWALTKADIPTLREKLKGAEGQYEARIVYLLEKLTGVTEEGNKEREKQGRVRSAPQTSGTGAAAQAKRTRD